MSKTAYLRNGEVVKLHDTLDANEFIIERMYVYSDYEGNEDSEPCGVREVVKEIFMKPPIEKKHDDLIKIIEKTEAKNKELAEVENQIRIAKNELRQSENFKTDLQKQIINRRELLGAKRLTVFSGFKAYNLEETEEKRSLKLSYSLNLWEGKFDAWVYQVFSDGDSGCSNHVNQKYGILINATDEEILEVGKQIVRDAGEIRDWDLKNMSDEYLTDELRAKKEEMLKNEKENKLKSLKEEIEKKQQELRELKTK